MKILILTQTVDEKHPILGFFVSWIQAFAEHVDQVSVIALSKGEYQLPENVSVYSLGKESGGGRVVRAIRLYRYAWRLRSEYDAVFVHMNPEYLILCGFFWRLMGKKVGLWYVHKAVNLRLRLGVLFAHMVFSASKESFRLKTKKLRITGHAIDTDFFAPGAGHKHDVLGLVTVGRLSPSKNVHVLIEAVAILKKEGTPVRLSIAGTAGTPEQEAYEKQLHHLVSENNLQDHVTFLGDVVHGEVPKLLQSADVFVNLSDTGSVDKAVLEAMAAGALVLTSNEAFRVMLKDFPGLFIQELTPRSVAEGVQKARDLDRAVVGASLRAAVVQNHSRAQTIPRIIETLS